MSVISIISDILHVAALAGWIVIDDDIAKKIKDVRDGASHATENLVSSYDCVKTLANVKAECLRILASLRVASVYQSFQPELAP